MILFADNFNFKEENFPSLFEYFKKSNTKFHFDDFNTDLKKSWGNYDNSTLNTELSPELEHYKNRFDFFDIAKDEFLSSLIINSNLLSSEDIYDEEGVLDFLKRKYPNNYERCKEVALYWVSYWFNLLKTKKIDAVIVFGGNLIYAKALLKVAEFLSLKCFVVEHFYTGNDFYFENRYSPIPNNSYIRSKRFLENIASDDFSFFSKINNQKNKNVKQPSYASIAVDNYVLLLCQVPNDFSILSPWNKWKNTLYFYKRIIKEILEKTNKNVVVKVHPYERVKNKGAFNTYDELESFISKLNSDDADRVFLVENFSLEGLINGCDFSVTINSQSGLDVVRLGKRLVCFGEPFYGRHGFTTDLTEVTELDFVLKKEDYDDLNFEKYNRFMSAVFNHLIGLNESWKINESFRKSSFDKNNYNISQKKNENIKIETLTKNDFPNKKAIAHVEKTLSINNDRRKRLIRKFKNDPKRFFEDSQNPLFRFIGKII